MEDPEFSSELVWDRFRVGTGGGLAIEWGTCGEEGALFVLLLSARADNERSLALRETRRASLDENTEIHR